MGVKGVRNEELQWFMKKMSIVKQCVFEQLLTKIHIYICKITYMNLAPFED